MRPVCIAEVDPVADDAPAGGDLAGLVQVDHLVFERRSRSLDEGVVPAAATAVDRDADAGLPQAHSDVEALQLRILTMVATPERRDDVDGGLDPLASVGLCDNTPTGSCANRSGADGHVTPTRRRGAIVPALRLRASPHPQSGAHDGRVNLALAHASAKACSQSLSHYVTGNQSLFGLRVLRCNDFRYCGARA